MVSDSRNRKAYLRDPNGLEQLLGRMPSAAIRDSRSPVAGTSLKDSELVDLLRRAMAGDGYPVSGGRETMPLQDNHAPLTSRIRDILHSEPEPVAPQPKFDPRPIYEQMQAASEPQRLVEPEPVRIQQARPPEPVAREVQPAPRSPAPVAPKAAEAAPIHWMPSFRAVGFVILSALAGGSIPALTASSPEYVADARLKLVGDARTAPGLLDATATRLTSSHVLSQAVARLKLEANPEFNGGGATAYGVTKDIFTDNGGASDNLSRAQASLRERLTVTREPQVGTIRLSVRSEDAAQSIRIANALAQIVASDTALSPDAAFASSSSDTSRKAYDDAMAALDEFKSQVGEDKIDAALKLQQQKQDLDRAIAKATSDAQAATIRLAAARAVKVADVLNGSISPDLGSPAALEDLRNRYASAKSALVLLATQLGPRHPRLLAQQATVDTLSGNIMSEIQKLISMNDLASRQATDQLKQLRNRAAALDTTTSGVDMAQLEKLQTDAETARSAYENELSAPTAAASTAAALPFASVVPATSAPSVSSGSTLLNEIYGFLAGLVVASCIVAARMFSRHLFRNTEPAAAPARQPQPQPVRQTARRAPIEPPEMHFDTQMPVANDRPAPRPAAPAASPAPVIRPVDPGVLEARQNVAALRARVESYAATRPLRR